MNPIDRIKESYEFFTNSYEDEFKDEIIAEKFQIHVNPKLYKEFLMYANTKEVKFNTRYSLKIPTDWFFYPLIPDSQVSEERGAELHAIILPKTKDRKALEKRQDG